MEHIIIYNFDRNKGEFISEKTIEVLDDTQAGMYVKENNYLKFHQLHSGNICVISLSTIIIYDESNYEIIQRIYGDFETYCTFINCSNGNILKLSNSILEIWKENCDKELIFHKEVAKLKCKNIAEIVNEKLIIDTYDDQIYIYNIHNFQIETIFNLPCKFSNNFYFAHKNIGPIIVLQTEKENNNLFGGFTFKFISSFKINDQCSIIPFCDGKILITIAQENKL